MTIKHLFTATLGLLLFCNFSYLESDIYYVSIEGLDTVNYKTVKAASQENSNITIESACVPAGIIVLKFSGDLNSAETNLRSFLNDNAEFPNIEFLEDFTEENYFEKCSDARVGR